MRAERVTNKAGAAAEVIARIPVGASVMIGGFMGVGAPHYLIDELVRGIRGVIWGWLVGWLYLTL